jgi:hypothetical protein
LAIFPSGRITGRPRRGSGVGGSSLGRESQLGSITCPAETIGRDSVIPGACSRGGWRVPPFGAPVLFHFLFAFSSSAVKRQSESPAGSVEESTEGETKRKFLVGVSNLTIKRKKWTG